VANICVFCGARDSVDKHFHNSAIALAQVIADSGHQLVYGGSTSGLMGVIAETAISLGVTTIGIRPHQLDHLEETHTGLHQLIEVNTMAERKTKMLELSDAFISLPGGYGTFDELFEVWTMRNIGQHNKPIGIVNYDGYYDQLISFLKTIENHQFASDGTLASCYIESDAKPLMQKIASVLTS
jgi:hypothetical protein